LKQEALNKRIQPHDAHAADNYDWRYLASVALFK
jgi:asparagine synthase (glutamine-hydrolysing)